MSTVRKKMSDVKISKAELACIKAMKDEDIDTSDIPELDDKFWKNAKLRAPMLPKKQVTLRINAEVLDWFKAQGKGYQTRMNEVLRHFYEAHQQDSKS